MNVQEIYYTGTCKKEWGMKFVLYLPNEEIAEKRRSKKILNYDRIHMPQFPGYCKHFCSPLFFLLILILF
jgi:hypothetical protein